MIPWPEARDIDPAEPALAAQLDTCARCKQLIGLKSPV
jgi:hypothetical protein